MNEERFLQSDLGQTFSRLIDSVYENIGGCLVEKLPGNKYRWGKHTGTREEIENIIRSKENLQNSIKQQST